MAGLLRQHLWLASRFGDASFNQAKFNVGANEKKLFYECNNYYGMMCIHFVGSKTHTGKVEDPEHQTSINTAYTEAKKMWPTLGSDQGTQRRAGLSRPALHDAVARHGP